VIPPVVDVLGEKFMQKVLPLSAAPIVSGNEFTKVAPEGQTLCTGAAGGVGTGQNCAHTPATGANNNANNKQVRESIGLTLAPAGAFGPSQKLRRKTWVNHLNY